MFRSLRHILPFQHPNARTGDAPTICMGADMTSSRSLTDLQLAVDGALEHGFSHLTVDARPVEAATCALVAELALVARSIRRSHAVCTLIVGPLVGNLIEVYRLRPILSGAGVGVTQRRAA